MQLLLLFRGVVACRRAQQKCRERQKHKLQDSEARAQNASAFEMGAQGGKRSERGNSGAPGEVDGKVEVLPRKVPFEEVV